MFEYLGDRLSSAIKNIKGMGKITEDNIDTAIREIRMALLEADVNYEIVKEFTNNVKTKALGLEVSKSLKPEEVFIKLIIRQIFMHFFTFVPQFSYYQNNHSVVRYLFLQKIRCQ